MLLGDWWGCSYELMQRLPSKSCRFIAEPIAHAPPFTPSSSSVSPSAISFICYFVDACLSRLVNSNVIRSLASQPAAARIVLHDRIAILAGCRFCPRNRKHQASLCAWARAFALPVFPIIKTITSFRFGVHLTTT